MRIERLLEISTDIQQAHYSKPFKSPRSPMPNSAIDQEDERYQRGMRAGMFSQVKSDRSDPSKVIKRSKYPVDPSNSQIKRGDIFGEFVKYLNEVDGFDNPYMPRVFSFKTIKDPTGKEVYKYRIERLNELKNISNERLKHIIKNVFSDLPEDTNIDSGKDLGHFLNGIVGDYINKGKASPIKNYIKDNRLLHAINMIKKFIRIENESNEWRQAMFDRAWNGLMYRDSSDGPQLVFADPVFDKYAY